MLAVVVDPLQSSDRIAIGLAGLLSEIFLQLGYDDQIPSGGDVSLKYILSSLYFYLCYFILDYSYGLDYQLVLFIDFLYYL